MLVKVTETKKSGVQVSIILPNIKIAGLHLLNKYHRRSVVGYMGKITYRGLHHYVAPLNVKVEKIDHIIRWV